MTKTDRVEKLKRFYTVIDALSAHGLRVSFADAHAWQSWPRRGVYFIFEPGEVRSDTGIGPRVVRVGTHALKSGSKSSLRGRTLQHRGKLDPPGGHHRGSIFRLLVGLALSQRDPGLARSTWGVGSTAATDVTAGERELEAAVSRTIARMEILFLPIDDEPGPDSLRGSVERNAIALLSNFDRDVLDAHSGDWLGAHCPRARVQRSGLWNNNHVDETCDPSFLNEFERLARIAVGGDKPAAAAISSH